MYSPGWSTLSLLCGFMWGETRSTLAGAALRLITSKLNSAELLVLRFIVGFDCWKDDSRTPAAEKQVLWWAQPRLLQLEWKVK